MRSPPSARRDVLREPLLVKRTLRAGALGTQRLLLQDDTNLVCVRYRENNAGTERYTTVELIIDRRPTPTTLVRIAVDWRETQLRHRLRNHGAQWDATRRCWLVPLRVARQLKLLSRVLGYELKALTTELRTRS
jgi:hypothetical protein